MRALTEGQGLPGSAIIDRRVSLQTCKNGYSQKGEENVAMHCNIQQPGNIQKSLWSPSFLSCNGKKGTMVVLLLMVGYLQLRAGKHTKHTKHTQEQFSLDEHKITSKDESDIRIGTTCSWQHTVIAARKSSTCV